MKNRSCATYNPISDGHPLARCDWFNWVQFHIEQKKETLKQPHRLKGTHLLLKWRSICGEVSDCSAHRQPAEHQRHRLQYRLDLHHTKIEVGTHNTEEQRLGYL